MFAPSQRGLSPRGICNPRSRHRPTPGILGFSTQPRKSPIFGDPPFFDFLTGVRTSECRHRRLWLMVRKAPNGPRTRLRHCHSSPQDASPRKINVFFGKIGRQSVNLRPRLRKKVSRIDDRLPKDTHFGPFLGSPPNDPRRARAPASWSPVIDLKSLWRSLRSVPHQRWGPQEHKPRDSMGRAAKPEQSAFSAVLGSDCSPLAKGAMYCT